MPPLADARDEETRRRRAAAGRSSTLLTGSQGDIINSLIPAVKRCLVSNRSH